jgi:hypothetical protein
MRRLLRAEWTKFRSVRRWMIATVVGAILTVVMTTFFASESSTNANDVPPYLDQFHFAHQTLTGDGSVTARVVSQDDSHEWARAGVMVKQTAAFGAPYAALYVTPGHGVRLQSNFTVEIAGGTDTAPRWLRLTRAGTQVTGYESVDGTQWTPVGEVTLDGLPATVEVGLFVSSPGVFTVEREFGSTTTSLVPTRGRATFDNIGLTGADGAMVDSELRGEDVAPPPDLGFEPPPPGRTTVDGETATVTGSGDIAYQLWGDDDVVLNSLSGVLAFLLVVIVVSVLFITSEFRRGLIRTTFTASPRRGRVILAKALVIAPVTFIAGLIAAGGSYVFSRPQLAENGFAAPSYPVRPITDPTVLRAVVGAALMLALVAVLGVSLGAILRRGAAAIALLMAALVAPQILLGALPLDVALWIGRATPTAGFAAMQTRERWDTAISPWAGLGVLAGYALVALVIAIGRLRWRDA